MKSRTKKLLGCGAIAALIIFGVIGYVVYKAYSIVSYMNPKVPNELKNAKVYIGENFFTKTELYKLESQSYIVTLIESVTIKDPKEREKTLKQNLAKSFFGFDDIKIINNQIVAAGRIGAYFFDLKGNYQSHILFEPSQEIIKIGPVKQPNFKLNLDNLKIVDLGKEKVGFVSFDSLSGTTVYNEKGELIWNYNKQDIDAFEKVDEEKLKKRKNVLQATVGDLDNDGIAEYIVANKNDGIHVFDQTGKEKWFQPVEFVRDDLQVIDTNNDGKNELFEAEGIVRNGENGKIIKEFKQNYGSVPVVIENGQKGKNFQFCDFDNNKLICTDEAEKTILEGEATLTRVLLRETEKPLNEQEYGVDYDSVYKPRAISVRLKKDQPKYLAIIGSFMMIPRSNLYVYDEKGMLVYHELLPENAQTMTILPDEKGNESILVGGKDTIWKFSAN